MFDSLGSFNLLVPVVNVYDSCMILWVRKLPYERINDASEAFNIFSPCIINFFLREYFLCCSELIVFLIYNTSHSTIFFHSL
jgi:hypothetical protein